MTRDKQTTDRHQITIKKLRIIFPKPILPKILLSIIATTLTYFIIILFNAEKIHLTALEKQWENICACDSSYFPLSWPIPVYLYRRNVCTNFNIFNINLASPGCELPECQVWEAVGPEEVCWPILLVSLPRLLRLQPLGGLLPLIRLSLLRTQTAILTKNYWKSAFNLWLIH